MSDVKGQSMILRMVGTLVGDRAKAKLSFQLVSQNDHGYAEIWLWSSAAIGLILSVTLVLAGYLHQPKILVSGMPLLIPAMVLLSFARFYGEMHYRDAERKGTVPPGLASALKAGKGWTACAAYAFLVGATVGLVCIPAVVYTRFFRKGTANEF